MIRWRALLAGILLCSGAGPATFARYPIATLVPSDVPEGYGNDFGWSVAISGDYIAVGAPGDPWYNGDQLGAVYVFRRIGSRWIEQAKLTTPDTSWPDQLGASVAMDGDVIVAGAPAWQYDFCWYRYSGAAYVFRRDNQGTPDDPADDTWFQEARLAAPEPEHGIGLGMVVAISGDRIVVGSDCGESAEVFYYSDGAWAHETSLVRSDVEPYQAFGSAVDIDGGRIAVGAHGYNERRGAAYPFVFSDGRWLAEGLLTVAESQSRDDFGTSLSLSGDYLLVGAPHEDNLGPYSNSGAVHAFIRSIAGEWTWHSTLMPEVPQDLGDFGSQLACDSSKCLIAPNTSWDSGIYLFGHMGGQWAEEGRLVTTPYRASISISRGYAVTSTHVYVISNAKTMRDYGGFQNCFEWSDKQALPAQCQAFDVDLDDLIDSDDFREFMATFGGP